MKVPRDIAASIRQELRVWFADAARDMPWRRTRDPYRIWLSEVMLQQTRVDQAIPYYERFVTRYPDVDALASAELDEVLRDWEGLGYYARARNVHRTARLLVRENGGAFPRERDKMLSLPGVGAYTAHAVLSIAGGMPLAAVDGNVTRVLSRLLEIRDDPRSTGGARKFQRLADDLLDTSDPGTFNQALMELGATVCVPKAPRCDICPVSTSCAALASGTVEKYPTAPRKARVPNHRVAAALIFDSAGRVFIQRRKDDGLLGGLWEFPGGKIEPGETPRQACIREVREELGIRVDVEEELPEIRHAYSHFKVVISPFVCVPATEPASTALPNAWVHLDELDRYAMPGATRKIVAVFRRQGNC